MIGGLSATDLMLIRAADAGELHVRDSRGYDEDGKPEGWPIIAYRDRIGSLERDGYLTVPFEGPVTVTGIGREVIA